MPVSPFKIVEIEIIDQAMVLETNIHRFFVTMEKEIEDKKIKEFLSFLAGEEYRHFNLLFNTKDYLSNLQELNPKYSQDLDKG